MPDANNSLRVLIFSLLLAAIAFVLHLPSTDFGFINYDDERVLCDHPEIYNQQGLANTVRAIFREYYPREEPLVVRDLTWALDSSIFGFTNPRGYHFTNVVLHSIVVSLLFVFLWLSSRRLLFSLITAALFMLLAVHVESVAWITGRKDMLVSIFELLSLLTVHMLLVSSSRRCAILWYAISMLMLALALGSKINATVFPGVLFLYALFFKSLRGEKESISFVSALRKGLWFLPHLAMSFAVFLWYNGVLTNYGLMDRQYSVSIARHICNLIQVDAMVLIKYIRLILLPNDLSLFYLWPNHLSNFGFLHKALALGVVTGMVVVAVLLWRKRKDLLFYYLTFLILMIPYMNLRYFGIWIANRYVYLSSFCVLAILADLLCGQLSSRRRIAVVLSAAALLSVGAVNLYAKLGWQKVWRNSESLWRYEISLQSTRVFAFENLAATYYARAISSREETDRIRLLAMVDDVVVEAENRFHPNKTSSPPASLYDIYFMKAIASRARGDDLEKQLASLKLAESLKPDFFAALEQLCIVYYHMALSVEGEARSELANHALDYFEKYIEVCRRDRLNIRKMKSMKQEFLLDFPFLSDRLVNIAIEEGVED